VSDVLGAQILVVDDEPNLLHAVRTALERNGALVQTADTGQGALAALGRYHPDLMLLDLGLPDIDGLEVIRQVRERESTPIVVLSVRGAERDKVTALDLGADDYLTKPFGVDELLARIRVALRHASASAPGSASLLRTGDLEVDLERRRVRVAGREVRLSPTEFNLLRALISHPNKVFTDQMLLRQVWGPGYGAEAHYLHVYVARLRQKIEADPRNPRYIITEPGVGYRLLAE
jgi:two-component system KDP operon response regulator KdpE